MWGEIEKMSWQVWGDKMLHSSIVFDKYGGLRSVSGHTKRKNQWKSLGRNCVYAPRTLDRHMPCLPNAFT